MGTHAVLVPETTQVRINRHPVKVTAMLYLKEALLAELYEECAEYIAIALEFGADPLEIRNLLEVPRRPF